MELSAITDLARLKASAIIGMVVVLGFVSVTKKFPSWDILILGSGTGFIVSASTNTINDILDLEIDKLEKPNRPLPEGRITISQAWYLFASETILGLILSFFLSIYSFALTGFVSVISILYSFRLKNYFLFKNILTAFGIASAYLVGAFAAGDSLQLPILLFFYQIMITVTAFELHKDIADIEGDFKYQKVTFATRFGAKQAAYIAVSLYIFAFVVFQGILLLSSTTLINYLWVVDIIGTLTGLSFLIPILRNQDPETIHRSRKRIMALLGVFVFASIIAFIDIY
ncbi:MAG: UbiA family prenyltransferase [Candidatus Hodarchaeales archaeon]|jgi:geranylgeranylglycerol-phosphate geranylgeranyltransferase